MDLTPASRLGLALCVVAAAMFAGCTTSGTRAARPSAPLNVKPAETETVSPAPAAAPVAAMRTASVTGPKLMRIDG